MEKLRWITGTASGLFLALYIAFFLFANSFRRSFGASPNAAWKLIVPLAVAGLVLCSALFPGQRWLLYITIIASIVTGLASLTIIRQAPIVSLLGVAYSVASLAWLLTSVNPPRPTP